MLDRSFAAAFFVPMSVSLTFGVIFATFITLVLVPTAYLIVDDVKRAGRWVFERSDALGAENDADR